MKSAVPLAKFAASVVDKGEGEGISLKGVVHLDLRVSLRKKPEAKNLVIRGVEKHEPPSCSK
jgi:hypothetical protein